MSPRAPETIVTPGEAFWNQREILREHLPRLRALQDAVAWPGDLFISQWAQLFTFAVEFRPDLIVELGRGKGNSTCVFTEAASVIGDCRVVSLCLSRDWEDQTEARVRPIVDADWFSRLEIHRGDIMDFDFRSAIGDRQRVLLFWDAHGFEIAEFVLGEVLPLLQDRDHIVAMHDLSDATQLSEKDRSYNGNRLWRGNDWDGPRVQIGHVDSAVEQSIAALDFTTRNQVPLLAADASLRELLRDGHRSQELRAALSDDVVSSSAHWFWFALDWSRPMTFPRFIRQAAAARVNLITRLSLALKTMADPAARVTELASGETQVVLPNRGLGALAKATLRHLLARIRQTFGRVP